MGLASHTLLIAKDGTEQVLRGASMLLWMDGQVRNLADLEKRQILTIQIDNEPPVRWSN